MNPLRDIMELDDIKDLINTFYAKVREDELLSDIFNNAIQNHWNQHLEKMYQFWQTILFGEPTYHGNPFSHHVNLPINKTHFDRWQQLFFETIDSKFAGLKADEAKRRASKIAEIFQYKMNITK